ALGDLLELRRLAAPCSRLDQYVVTSSGGVANSDLFFGLLVFGTQSSSLVDVGVDPSRPKRPADPRRSRSFWRCRAAPCGPCPSCRERRPACSTRDPRRRR